MKARIFTIFSGLIISISVSFAQNNALNFDGSDDYVNCGNILAGGSASVTYEAWIYANNPANGTKWTGIIYHGLGAESQGHLGINPSGYLSGGTGHSTSWQTHITSYLIPTNIWVHVAMVINRNEETISFYANGMLIQSFAHSVVPISTTDPLTIGLGASDEYFDGEIDEVRIWDDVRTETEIRQNMYRELPNPSGEDNLVSYYKLNETSGTTATDSKGSNNGTLTNYGGQSEYWQTSPAFFGPKNCLDFDGGNDWINTSVTMPSVYTKEAWVYIPSFNGRDNNIVSGGPSDGQHAFWISVGNSYKLSAGHNGVWNAVQDPNQIPFDSWQHIAVTYDADGTMTLYRNGIQVDQTYGVADFISGTKVRIGSFGDNSNNLGGKIDEVRIWNDVRTEFEIRKNMCKTLTGNESGLVAYYNFDNSSGSTLQDFSGNGNDGTLTNMDNSDWVTSSAFNTWLNTDDSDWSNITNWSRGSKPINVDNLGIFSYSGGSTPNFDNSDEAEANHMVVDLSSGWTIGGDLFIS